MRATKLSSRKVRAIFRKGPATARNILYSWLGVWPVGTLDGADLQDVPTYCISLRRAAAKRALIERQVAGLGLRRFEFLDAVDATELDRDELRATGRLDEDATQRFHGRVLSLNEIACSLSHGRAYELIRRRRHELALIVEDDALFVSSRMRAFRLADVPPDFDCVFLSAFHTREPPPRRIAGCVHDEVTYDGSSAAYLVSARGADKLADCHLPVIHAADGLLGRSLVRSARAAGCSPREGARTALRAYVCYPDLVLNGSAAHYHVSEIPRALPRKPVDGVA